MVARGREPFYPVMTHFTLPLHATREELAALAAGWAQTHDLHLGIERYFPRYNPAAPALGADLDAAIAAFADHFHTAEAHDLAASGVRMLAATGSTVFAFDDLD